MRTARDAVTWYCYLLLGYFSYLVSIQGNIVPYLKAELDLSFRAVSLHTSAIAVGGLFVGFAGERILRRYGRRRMLAVGALGAAFGAVLLTLAPTAWASIGSCLVFGLFGAFLPAIVTATLSGIHGVGRDVAFTEANAIAYAFAIMAPLITGLAAWQGWDWRIVPLAGVAAGIGIVAAFRRLPIADRAPAAAAVGTRLPPAFWSYMAMLGFGTALEFSVLLWAPAYLEEVVGLSPSSAAIAASAFFVAMLLGRTVGIRLVRAFATRRLFLAAAATTLVGFAAYWGSGAPAVSIAGLFVTGLGISLLFPLCLGFAMTAAGPAAERASVRIMLAPALAILLNPPLLGWIADSAGLHAAQIMIAVFMILAVAAFFIAERLGRSGYSVSSS